MINPTYFDAVYSLVGGKMGGSSDGPVSDFVFEDNQTPPSESEIQTELTRLQAEYDAQEYARKRQAEYPSIAELTVALYDTSDKAALVAKRAAVKLKYPKG